MRDRRVTAASLKKWPKAVAAFSIATHLCAVEPEPFAARQTLQSDEILVSVSSVAWDVSAANLVPSSSKYPYPAIITGAADTILVGYIDSKAKFVIRAIRDDTVSDFFEMDCYPNTERLGRLPQMFASTSGVAVASVARDILPDGHTIDIVYLNALGKPVGRGRQLTLPKQRRFPKSKYYGLDTVMAVDSERGAFLVVGEFRELYFSHGIIPIVPDPQGFTKNCAFFLRDNRTNPVLQRIEARGRFYVSRADYATQTDGALHCAWIRRDDGAKFSKKRNESVCYSAQSGEGAWSKPALLYSESNETGLFLADIAVATTGKDAFVIWARDQDGVYFVGLEDGKASKSLRIGSWQGYDSGWSRGIRMFSGAPICDITIDSSGNVFAVWALNRTIERTSPHGRAEHEIVLKARLGGEWTPEFTVSIGDGIVRSPKVLLDSTGQIHIAYLKQTTGERFGCFYRKTEIARIKE